MRLLISGSWVRAPRWAIIFFFPFDQEIKLLAMRCMCYPHISSTAPWLSWLKRLSSKQEIPSSNLGGASIFFTACREIHALEKKKCRDPGSNRGPLDLQSNALPTELSRQGYMKSGLHIPDSTGKSSWAAKGKVWLGSTEIWTRIAGFRVQSANHYTTGPMYPYLSLSLLWRLGINLIHVLG